MYVFVFLFLYILLLLICGPLHVCTVSTRETKDNWDKSTYAGVAVDLEAQEINRGQSRLAPRKG